MSDLLEQTSHLLWPIGAAAFGIAATIGYLALRRGEDRRRAPRPDPGRE